MLNIYKMDFYIIMCKLVLIIQNENSFAQHFNKNLCTILVIVQTCFQTHIYMYKVSKVLYRNHISILDNCNVVFYFLSPILMSYTVVLTLVVKNRQGLKELAYKDTFYTGRYCRQTEQCYYSHIFDQKLPKELNNCFT